MSISGGIVVFFITWWVVLFTVLPWGIRHDDNPTQGNVTSAPSAPRLGLKFLITTGITAIIWIVVYLLVQADIIDFYGLAEQMSEEDYQ
ncbi:MAG: DUF1467 family protein [Rhodospirillales bacterium]|nr:DUF1467 family protein [Rhodospirillales bacterium]MCB9995603.1 DUF1467 family protein [Rhodospirillales bacterium]